MPLTAAALLLTVLLGATRPPVSSASAVEAGNGDARNSYLRGRAAMTRHSTEALRNAAAFYQQSIAADSRFAPAYAGLAEAWSGLAGQGVVDAVEAAARAREAASRALRFGAALPETHATLGRLAIVNDWDWASGMKHFSRAIDLQPEHAAAHQWIALALSAGGRHDEAVREARMSAALEPMSLAIGASFGFVLYAARRYDEAADQLLLTLQVDPEFGPARRHLARVRAAQGRTTDAVVELERAAALERDSPTVLAELAWARGRCGDLSGAAQLLERIERVTAGVSLTPDGRALALIGAGRPEEAIAALRSGFEARAAGMVHLAEDPVWDSVRSDPRVQAMVSEIRVRVRRVAP
jgi:serine/threonine-protein kinase